LVRLNIQAVSGTSSRASSVNQRMSVTKPRSTLAVSEMKKMFQSLIVSSTSETPRTVNEPALRTRGDWDTEPPCIPPNTRSDRYRARPGARMLIATPDTIWSTPNWTVAIAWSRPPRAPPTSPATSPHQGEPNSSAPHAPHQVPRIIMPSSPMLTMPERSANRPPSPASRIGIAHRSIALDVPLAVSSEVPLTPCTAESTKMPIAAISAQRAHAGIVRRMSPRPEPRGLVEVSATSTGATLLMSLPPPGRCPSTVRRV
jgi:hypothetical protein